MVLGRTQTKEEQITKVVWGKTEDKFKSYGKR